MNLNFILLAIISFAALFTLARGLYVDRPQQRGWTIIAGLTMLIIAVSWSVWPSAAGLIAGGVWTLLVLLPALGLQLINRLVYQQRYKAAYRLMRGLRWLHPLDGWWEQPQIYQALSLARQGNMAEARQVLAPHQTTDTPLGRSATVHLYRLTADWAAIIQWVEEALPSDILDRDPNILLTYLRTLGEMGEINKLVSCYEQYQPDLHHNSNMARLFVFAFSGQQQEVTRLLDGPFREFSPTTRLYWQGVTAAAAGEAETAQQKLAVVRLADDLLARAAAERHLQQPHPPAETQLTPQAISMLKRVKLEQHQEERFSGAGYYQRHMAYITNGLILINALFFGAEILLGGSQNPTTLFFLGALVPQAIFEGQWWRLLNFTFLHYGWLHLVLNMTALYLFGPFVELTLGWRRYLSVYLVSGIGAGLAVVAVAWLRHMPRQILVGASGGVMGLVGATAAIMLHGWHVEKSTLASQRLFIMLLIIVVQVGFDIIVPQTSLIAHASGALLGFGLTGLFMWRAAPLAKAISST